MLELSPLATEKSAPTTVSLCTATKASTGRKSIRLLHFCRLYIDERVMALVSLKDFVASVMSYLYPPLVVLGKVKIYNCYEDLSKIESNEFA